jgi:hypothetical protein
MRRGELTVKQAAVRSGFSPANVYAVTGRGRVLSRRVRGHRLVDMRSFDAYVAKQNGEDPALDRARARLRREILNDLYEVRQDVKFVLSAMEAA